MNTHHPLVRVLALAAALVALPAARADFSGDFATTNWSLHNEHGSFIWFTDSHTLTMLAPDDRQHQEAIAKTQITIGETGTVAFHYEGRTDDTWGRDRIGYSINGTTTWLDSGTGNALFSGDDVISVNIGDEFAFVAWSLDSMVGTARLTITNFDFTPAAVPEPASVAALAGLGALGLAVLRRRRA